MAHYEQNCVVYAQQKDRCVMGAKVKGLAIVGVSAGCIFDQDFLLLTAALLGVLCASHLYYLAVSND